MLSAIVRPRPIVLLASSVLCTPGIAGAQGASASPSASARPGSASASASASASDQDRADALFLQGKAAAQAKNWNAAYERLTQAWALKQSYDIASNLGQVAYLLGKHAEAAQHVSFALRHYPATGDADQKQKIEDLLAMVRQKVSSLSLRVSPQEAEVFVDGTSAGRAGALPSELFVDPGERTVTARLEDQTVERHVSAQPGGHYKLELTFAENPAASVAAPLPTTGADAAPNRPAEPTDAPTSNSAALSTKNIVLIATGALTVGSGIALGIYAAKRSKANSDVDSALGRVKDESSDPNHCTLSNTDACQDLAQSKDDWKTSGQVINVLVPTTVVFAAGFFATLFLWPSDSDDSTTTALTPVLSAEQQGVLLSGSF